MTLPDGQYIPDEDWLDVCNDVEDQTNWYYPESIGHKDGRYGTSDDQIANLIVEIVTIAIARGHLRQDTTCHLDLSAPDPFTGVEFVEAF